MTADSATGAAIATNRFGFCARPGEPAAARGDPRGWILQTLRRPYRPPDELAGLASGRELLAAFLAVRAERAAERRARAPAGADAAQPVIDTVRERLLPHYLAQASAPR